MDAAIADQIRALAGDACEYCRLPQHASRLRFVLDHVIARQHVVRDEIGNLALCCGRCNLHKGPNIAGIDPDSGELTRLFHPRQDRWTEHFRWDAESIMSPIGRATVAVLAMNQPSQLAVRAALRVEGGWP
jgi:hypothetical protein